MEALSAGGDDLYEDVYRGGLARGSGAPPAMAASAHTAQRFLGLMQRARQQKTALLAVEDRALPRVKEPEPGRDGEEIEWERERESKRPRGDSQPEPEPEPKPKPEQQ